MPTSWYPGKIFIEGPTVAAELIINYMTTVDKAASKSIEDLTTLSAEITNQNDAAVIQTLIEATKNHIGDIEAAGEMALADTFIGKRLHGPREKAPSEDIHLSETIIGKKLHGPRVKARSENVDLSETFIGKKLHGPEDKVRLEDGQLAGSLVGKMLQKGKYILSDMEKSNQNALQSSGASKSFLDQVAKIMNDLVSALNNAISYVAKMVSNLFSTPAKVQSVQQTKKIRPELSDEDKGLEGAKNLFNQAQHQKTEKTLERQQQRAKNQLGQHEGLAGVKELFANSKQEQKNEAQKGKDNALESANKMFTGAQYKYDNKEKSSERVKQKNEAQQGQQKGLEGARKMYTHETNKYEGAKASQAREIKNELNKQKGQDNNNSGPVPRK